MKRPFHFMFGKAVLHGLTALVLLFVASLLIAGFVPVKHPWCARLAVKILQGTGADSVSIESVELVAWKSVTLHGLYLKFNSDSQQVTEIKSSKVVLSVTLIELLMKQSKFTRAKMAGNADRYRGAGSRQELGAMVASIVDAATISGEGAILVARDVIVTVVEKNKILFAGSRGELSAVRKPDDSKSLYINAVFPVVSTLGEGIQEVKGSIRLTREGPIDIQEVVGRYLDGKVRAKGTIKPGVEPQATFTLSVDKMDLAWWYTLHEAPGVVSGRATIHVKGSDVPLRRIREESEYNAVVNDLKIAGLPLQKSLATSLFLPSINQLMFKKLEFGLRHESGDSLKAQIVGTGDQILFMSTGYLHADGRLSQQVDGTFTKAYIKTFPKVVRQVLDIGKDDGWKFRCRLYGTYADPRFELDKETLQRALGGMFRSMQQNIMESLLK